MTTRWSVVLAAAGEADRGEISRALGELCRIYWSPLYAFARRRGRAREDAQDDVQGFLVDLLARRNLADVSPERGRFRSFMLAAFKHYILNQIDRQQAQKRGGDQEFVPFETARVETWLADGNTRSPEETFDRQWALRVLEEALARLRATYTAKDQELLFDHIKGCLSGEQLLPYSDIAAQCDCAEGAVKVAVHRLRRRYQGALREVIAETVEQPVDIDNELNHLRDALS